MTYKYNFSSRSTDPENHQIYYNFSWDDGTTSGWLGPYESGAVASASHSWSAVESYDIQVEARDRFGFESLGSPYHQIHIDNSPPASPIVTGPTEGIVGFDYEFSATTFDPDGNQILYQFSWDDGTTSDWLGPYDSGEPAFASHTWVAPDSYNVYVQAKDMFGGLSDPSKYHLIHITNHAPATPGAPQGPSEGETFEEYSFTAVSSDPDGHQLYYMFDWDDGTYSDWIGPYPSNVPVTAEYAWVFSGWYDVRVKAKDAFNAESDWSNEHMILIDTPPLNPGLPAGEEHGVPHHTYTYTVVTDDPDGDHVQYQINWGDGQISDWFPIPPAASGVSQSANHWWPRGNYDVSVRAKDAFEVISGWSDPLHVDIRWINLNSSAQFGLVAGTQVTLPNGATRDIVDVVPGDLVQSYDYVTGKAMTTMVTRTYQYTSEETTDYYLVINNQLCVTPNHLMYINDAWMYAADATIGDHLLDVTGIEVNINSIEPVFQQVTTYDLETLLLRIPGKQYPLLSVIKGSYFADNILVSAHTSKLSPH